MLVDPLAAFFRPDLEGEPPLRLDITRVEVELLPPLARVVVARTFINTGDRPIEAVLTLPPAQPDEVVHGLAVMIDGVDYRATARPRRAAGRAHDAATAQGRISILHERVANDVQLISIAGIGPMSTVEVRVESVRALTRDAAGVASLLILLSADPRRLNRGLDDADRMLTTPDRHPAKLTVIGAHLDVALAGQEAALAAGEAVAIDCAAPVALSISAPDAARLDRTEQDVTKPGGWAAAVEPPQPSMAGGLAPVGGLSAGLDARRDWIAGRTAAGGVGISVVAPSPLSGVADLSPNARAMAAFAAAHLVESATTATAAELRRAANVLDRQTSLAFLGPAGDALAEMPRLRKVALPTNSATKPPPLAEPPAEPAAPRPTDLPRKPDGIVPGKSAAAPPFDGRAVVRWIVEASPFALILLCGLGATVWLPRVPLGPVAAGVLIALLVNVVLHLPRGDGATAARRRLWWLLTLALPPFASWVSGPFGPLFDLHPADLPWVNTVQIGCIAAAAIFPLGLMFVMRGARRLTIDIGILALALTFLSVSLAIITLSPGA